MLWNVKKPAQTTGYFDQNTLQLVRITVYFKQCNLRSATSRPATTSPLTKEHGPLKKLTGVSQQKLISLWP